MGNIFELNKQLSLDCNHNYWSDELCESAIAVLMRCSSDELAELANVWRYKPVLWQVRFAEILDSADPNYSVAVLINMITLDENLELTEAAADSLHSIIQTNPKINFSSFRKDVLFDRLDALAEKKGGVVKIVVDLLTDKIKFRNLDN